METIRVNMTPCEDVQTIHASQNDNEAREWGFELHNNGEKIDSSSISDQLVFKAYEGGTEQILPENGSTPTTSPFKGDIKYSQGLLVDQEFTYRQSPTESDGLAKIQTIYGNTLKWNQLCEVVNPSSTSSGITMTNNGDGSFTLNGTATAQVDFRFDQPTSMNNLKNYPTARYLFFCDNISSSVQFIVMSYPDYVRMVTYTSSPSYGNAITGRDNCFMLLRVMNGTTLNNAKFRPQWFNLTEMFGSGNEPTTVGEFTSLFSLPYYDYNQGTLLSFNGNGIKTVGKNLFDLSQFANGTITFENGDLTGTAAQFYTSYRDVVNNGIELKYPKNTQITISFDARTEQNQSPSGGGVYLAASENGISVQLATTLNNTTAIQHITVTIPSDRHIDKLGWTYGSSAQNIWHITNFQVEFGTTETSYEPYTESTLSLPISTYFPNGMKSAGSVYDELTETKAITRIGSVDLGSLTWEYRTTGSTYAPYFYTAFTGIKPNGNPNVRKANILCSKYSTAYRGQDVFIDKTICADGSSTELTQLQIKDSSYTDATAFKQAMTDQNVKLYYELSTPTETSFTTASLVTENAEIPLSAENDVLIGKCTEELSTQPGFIDAKIKLTDGDGTCYSNKIQLHVERKPS